MNDPSPLEAIFFAALEKGSPEERVAYLDEACADSPDLRLRVGKMLAAQAPAASREKPVSATEEGDLESQEHGNHRLRHVGSALVQIGSGTCERTSRTNKRHAQSRASQGRLRDSCTQHLYCFLHE
jgi:hypothetical protein